MRSLRFSLFALAVALAIPSSTSAQPVTDSIPTLTPVLVGAEHVPAPARRDHAPMPFELAGLGVALATAKKAARKPAAKKSGSKPAAKKSASADVAMYLDSDVHVMRENKKGDPVTTTIKGGVLVDDTDLTDEEIDDFTARRVIRPAKPEEIERLKKAPGVAEREQLVREQAAEVEQLQAKHASAVAAAAPADRPALQEEQATELTELQQEHVDALNAFDEKQGE
jgi:hypothetical protein